MRRVPCVSSSSSSSSLLLLVVPVTVMAVLNRRPALGRRYGGVNCPMRDAQLLATTAYTIDALEALLGLVWLNDE